MTAINEFVLTWWPVAVGIYTCLAGVVTLYTRAVSGRLQTMEGTIRENERVCTERAEKQARELAAHRLHVAETYSTASETANLFGQLLDALRRIEDKLERKVDK